jgi:poly-gamma-glutamate synthesis protein (capsule biosynthesis protein)
VQKSGICGARFTTRFALVLAGVLLAGGAGAGADVSPSPEVRATPPARTKPARAPGGPVVLAFGGDVHFEGQLRGRLAADPLTALAPMVPLFAGADLVMVNLETAIGTGGTPQIKAYTFRAPASAFTALRAAHVDVVTMANNHGMDYGAGTLEESLRAAEDKGFPVVGIGRNARAAYRPYRVERKGERIAIFGATQVLDDELEQSWTATDHKSGLASAKHAALQRLLAAVRSARPHADIVVVYLHWGQELVACPTQRQRDLMRALVAAGADVIVGSHAHLLLGHGYFGRAYVDYGLGNFAFYANADLTRRTGVLLVTVRGRNVVSAAWRPAMIYGGVPSAVPDEQRAAATDAADRLRACTDLSAVRRP